MRRRAVLAAPLALGGCAFLRRRRHKPALAPPDLHAVLGPPYQINGVWHYPHESYEYDETGLAVIAGPHGPYATDGAPWDPAAMMAAHPTLQLPAVARVTNLESGRQILLRLDDRGPAAPGRLLAVTPRVALLLGTGGEPGVLRVRVRVEEELSRLLSTELGEPEAPPLALAAAPAGEVRVETLGPPGSKPTVTPSPPAAVESPRAGYSYVHFRDRVEMVPVTATALWIDAGGLGGKGAAEMLRGRLAAFDPIVTRDFAARAEVAWRVRVGPFATVAQADAMLDRMLARGVVDARIIVV